MWRSHRFTNAWWLSVAIAVAFCTVYGAPTAAAQAQGPPSVTEYVIVALVPDLGPKGGDAILERRAAGNPKNLILLRADNADPLILATAVTSLFYSRRRAGDAPANDIVIRIHGRRNLTSLTPQESRLATEHFGRLKAARPSAVTGYGTVPAIRIALGRVTR